MKQIILSILFFTSVYGAEQYSNALVHEDSPYLQQHVHNPVNWYPWGEEAFEKAEKEDKLIFLSIGYSTCHWCHVMEEESFTDEEVSKLLNESFVSIKVDREEYPQLDNKYQKLYMYAHGKRGGWPLSVFMSPQAEPFFLGTYIHKGEEFITRGLMYLLPYFVGLQNKNTTEFQKLIDKHKIVREGKAQKEHINKISANKIIDKFLDKVSSEFDKTNGGFSARPKFPEASKITLLFDIYKLRGDKKALYMAEMTLKKMAKGGIYDQIGGGFFRYTTDYEWQMPHFEKMLYTNAELVSVYANVYMYTKEPLYKKVVVETIAQMEENYMQGGMYLAASDADSDGEEGGYFIYEYVTVKEDLLKLGMKEKEVEEVLAYLGIEEDGNIDGDFSHVHIMGDKVPDKLEEVKEYLSGISAKRTFPFIDKKIITSWNAMMIKALLLASKVEKRYLALGIKRLEYLWTLMRKEKVLYHQTLLGKAPRQKALLEDYAFLIDALIEAYERTYNKQYLEQATQLTQEAVHQFYKKQQWFLSNDGIEALADFDDKYYTSSLSLMLENLVRLASLTEDLEYNKIVKNTMKQNVPTLETTPTNTAKLLHTFLRLEKGDVIIKAPKKKLQKSENEIESIDYPFILSKSEESDKYLACRVSSCFAYDSNLTKLIEKINKSVGP
ncbi:thioredoxin domain-containing protein [Sulfurovum sp.]|uniref:thioredoxin domain-containing protein n=1 Tax=Sulfurovum sp. TaxID=1969726 RepID=UPI0028680DBC|nr:thioredoxin domain-containing protein [Sulfurovum sp.]